MKLLLKSAALLAAGVLLYGPATAQTGARAGERISQLVVYGADPCPRGVGDEVVVCVRRREGDRYRVPEELREGPRGPENESWAARVQSVEYVGRTGIQSCSPVGPGGFTGCWAEMMRQAREDRRVNPEGQTRP